MSISEQSRKKVDPLQRRRARREPRCQYLPLSFRKSLTVAMSSAVKSAGVLCICRKLTTSSHHIVLDVCEKTLLPWSGLSVTGLFRFVVHLDGVRTLYRSWRGERCGIFGRNAVFTHCEYEAEWVLDTQGRSGNGQLIYVIPAKGCCNLVASQRDA